FRAVENADLTVTLLGPVSEDSRSWVSKRLDEGIHELNRANLPILGFEAPHYAASSIDYQVIAEKFRSSYHRNLYFEGAVREVAPAADAQSTKKKKTAKKQQEEGRGKKGANKVGAPASTTPPPPMHFGGQFFPYPIARDIYGQQ